MPKYIRELRMGRPKMFKTGAVVGTYPKPLLYLGFDRDGISIIPRSSYKAEQSAVVMDCSYEDITFAKTGTMSQEIAKPTHSKITVFDYTQDMPLELMLTYTPQSAQLAAQQFQAPLTGDYNQLVAYYRKTGSIPWKTIVFDSMTGYGEVIKMHLAQANPNAMADARQWAYMTGEKQRQLCLSMTGLPAHIVVIFHTTEPEVNEETKMITELPNAYAKSFRDVVGGLFSQYFYATKEGGKPVIKNADHMFVKGVGSRWPAGLAATVAPDFNSIYGRENLL